MNKIESKQVKLIVGLDNLYTIDVNDINSDDEIRHALINRILSDTSNLQVEIIEEII